MPSDYWYVADSVGDTVVARCSCGWQGTPVTDPSRPRAEWQAHADEQHVGYIDLRTSTS